MPDPSFTLIENQLTRLFHFAGFTARRMLCDRPFPVNHEIMDELTAAEAKDCAAEHANNLYLCRRCQARMQALKP